MDRLLKRGPHGVRIRYPYNPRLIVVRTENVSPVAILERQVHPCTGGCSCYKITYIKILKCDGHLLFCMYVTCETYRSVRLRSSIFLVKDLAIPS